MKLKGQLIENQFGSFSVDLAKPELLLVPSSKDPLQPPGPLAPDLLNHFACYRLRGARFKTTGLQVEDQISPYLVDIKKPFRLCVPTDKEGEGIVDPAAAMTCYKHKSTPKRPPYAGPFFTEDQFGAKTLFITRTREFCVPTTLIGP